MANTSVSLCMITVGMKGLTTFEETMTVGTGAASNLSPQLPNEDKGHNIPENSSIN
jgi:hypothetical protein